MPIQNEPLDAPIVSLGFRIVQFNRPVIIATAPADAYRIAPAFEDSLGPKIREEMVSPDIKAIEII